MGPENLRRYNIIISTMSMERVTTISAQHLGPASGQFKGKKILIVSKRGSGRSRLAEAIARSLPREPNDRFVVATTLSEKRCPFWTDKLDRCNILYSPQTILATPPIDQTAPDPDPYPYPYECVVLDDCVSEEDPNLIDGMGRLLVTPNLTLIFVIQFMFLETELVDMFDIVMIGAEDFADNRRHIHERVSTGLDYDIFDQQVKSLSDYKFLMVDTEARVPTSEDDPGLRTVDLADAGIRSGDHILVVNRDDEYTTRFVRAVIGHLQPDDICVVNRFGQNRYGPIGQIVPTVYDASASDSVSEMFSQLISLRTKTRKKLLVVEYALRRLMIGSHGFLEILHNARLYGITLVVVERSAPSILNPELRSNFDRVVLGRFIDDGPLRRVYDQYCGLLPDHYALKGLSGHIDSDRALMIDNRTKSTVIEDMIFYLTLSRIPTAVSPSESSAPTRPPTLEDIMRYLQEMDRKVERVIAHVEQGTSLCPDR